MRTEGMPERMTGDTLRPAESSFVCVDMSGKIKRINGFARIKLFWKKPACRLIVCEPVLREDIQRFMRKNGIAVRTIFRAGDVNTHLLPFDMFIAEMADFPDTQPGRIHDSHHSLLF